MGAAFGGAAQGAPGAGVGWRSGLLARVFKADSGDGGKQQQQVTQQVHRWGAGG